MKEKLSWVDLLCNLPTHEKKTWIKTLLDGIKSYRKSKSKDDVYLTEMLEDGEFKCVGFSTAISYITSSTDQNSKGVVFHHPWGTPALIYKHKRLPLVIITSPSLRHDETIDGKRNVQGFTG
jgi:hypothetical protein